MLLLLFSLLAMICQVLGGSPCPTRRSIHPCYCINIEHGKKSLMTIVTCSGLKDSEELTNLLPKLSSLDIDQLHVYDSFTNAPSDLQVLPMDWTKVMETKELVVSDSALSSCFACQWQQSCVNNIIRRFAIINSSNSERICSLCSPNNSSTRVPWTGCLKSLRHFQFSHGNQASLTGDLFPDTMAQLTTLDLSHNKISKIDPNAFKNMPALLSLDLSHNSIEFVDHAFFQRRMKLQSLDLSSNLIKQLWQNIFVTLPNLKNFNLANNAIQNFTNTHWQNPPNSLRSIDLTNNPVRCDCTLRWVNETFKVHVTIGGVCSTPVEFLDMPVRRASKNLNERCTASGRIGTRPPKTKQGRH